MIRAEVEVRREEFEALLRIGQAPNWTPDQRTRDIWCLGKWIEATMAGGSRRVELLWYFNRIVRSEHDPFEAAAKVMAKLYLNEPLEDHYQRYFHQYRR